MLFGALGARLTATAHTLLKHAADLNAEARDTIAHGQLRAFRETEYGRPAWQLVRHVARKRATIVVHSGQSRHWAQQGRVVLRLAQRWRTCAAKMHPRLGHLSSDDLAKVCLAQFRASKPSRTRRHRRPPPRKAGSMDRQAQTRTMASHLALRAERTSGLVAWRSGIMVLIAPSALSKG